MKTKLASSLPLQDMIRATLANATEKLASDRAGTDAKVRKLVAYEKEEHGHIPTPEEERAEKTASQRVDPEYVEKLASVCEYISKNAHLIEPSPQSAIKAAAEGSPAGAGKGKGALEVLTAIGGKQQYKKDKPAGEDAAASQAGSPLSAGGLPGGKSQMENTMHHAPGGGGIAPTGKYPAEGPLRAEKKASVRDRYIEVVEASAAEILEKQAGRGQAALLSGLGGAAQGGLAGAISADKGERGKGFMRGAAAGGTVGAAAGGSGHMGRALLKNPRGTSAAYNAAVTGAGSAAGAHEGKRLSHGLAGAGVGAGLGAASGHAHAKAMENMRNTAPDIHAEVVKHMSKNASAADIAREHILLKLAGEDVMKANITSPKDADALPGGGELEVMQSGENGPKASGGPTSSDGNQGRRHIASNQAAIDMTKKDAKGPQKTQLGEVLDEPALSAAHDSKLNENLRNAGKAGVKIAAVAAFRKIASEGCKCEGKGECSYCHLKTAAATLHAQRESEKTANAMMGMGAGGGGASGGMAPSGGGGMSAMATAGAGADGCTCGNTGECRVCKLKAALAAARAGGMPGGEGHPMAGGVPPEKDSTMGMGAMGGC